jgi:hypothetical protein
MNKPVLEIIKRWTRLAMEAKQLGLTTIPIDPENMLMVLGELPSVRRKSPPIARMTIRLRSTFCARERPANLMAVLERTTTHLSMRQMNWKMPRHLGGRSVMSLDCVPLSTYCRDAGETVEAVNKRIQRGLWKEGVHVLKVDGVKERWIDLTEVSKWARKNKDHYLSQEE